MEQPCVQTMNLPVKGLILTAGDHNFLPELAAIFVHALVPCEDGGYSWVEEIVPVGSSIPASWAI